MHTYPETSAYQLVLLPCLILFALSLSRQQSKDHRLSNFCPASLQHRRSDPSQLQWPAAEPRRYLCYPLVSSGTGAWRVKVIEVSATFDFFGLLKMLLPAYSETLTSHLSTANKTSFVPVIVAVRPFKFWKPRTLIEIVRSWRKQTIQIL